MTNRAHCRLPRALEEFLPQMEAYNARLVEARHPPLIKEELVGSRLYTGCACMPPHVPPDPAPVLEPPLAFPCYFTALAKEASRIGRRKLVHTHATTCSCPCARVLSCVWVHNRTTFLEARFFHECGYNADFDTDSLQYTVHTVCYLVVV